MSADLLFDLTTFVLAVLVGFEVISKVPQSLQDEVTQVGKDIQSGTIKIQSKSQPK